MRWYSRGSPRPPYPGGPVIQPNPASNTVWAQAWAAARSAASSLGRPLREEAHRVRPLTPDEGLLGPPRGVVVEEAADLGFEVLEGRFGTAVTLTVRVPVARWCWS